MCNMQVYVIGERTVVSMRPSLGDKHLGHAAREGVLALPRISCKSATDLSRHDSESGPECSVMHLGPGSSGGRRSSGSTLAGGGGLGSGRWSGNGGTAGVEGSSGLTTSAAGCPGPVGLPRSPLPTPPATARNNGVRSSSAGGGAASRPLLQGADSDEPLQGNGCGASVDGFSSGCTQPPPPWATHALATVLRQRLGLELFNFDLICPSNTQQLRMQHRSSRDSLEANAPPDTAAAANTEWLYYVVDVNYFPGVDKIPNFEAIFVDFLKDACKGWGCVRSRGESGNGEGEAWGHAVAPADTDVGRVAAGQLNGHGHAL